MLFALQKKRGKNLRNQNRFRNAALTVTSFCLVLLGIKNVPLFIFDKTAVISANKKKEHFPSQPFRLSFRRKDFVLSVTKQYVLEIEKKKQKTDYKLRNKNSKQ